MLKLFANYYAKLSYRFGLLVEAGRNDVNARLAQKNAQAKRDLVQSLNDEADAMDKRIKEVAEMEEKGYWVCECGKENTTAAAVPQAEGHAIHCDCGKEMKLITRETMTGQEKYESDKERGEAENMVASKRALAKQEAENVSNFEQTAQAMRSMSANAAATAEKIKSL